MNLPPELWLKITQYLSKQDLILSVSKRYNSLLRSELYRDVVLNLNSFQKFCVLIASSAIEEDLCNEQFKMVLNDILSKDDHPEDTHHDLSTLQDLLLMIQNPDQDLNSLLERITEPLLDIQTVCQGTPFLVNPVLYHGYGKYVKSLAIPSDGFSLKFLKILEFLPNLRKITFYHPPHDEKWIPFLKPKVLEAIASNFQSLHSLVIEDLSKIVWKPLINILSQFGSQLLHLTIEASGELEPFFTSKGVLGALAQNLPNLKVLRLDGIPAGNDDSTFDLVRKCQKLECIVLDYCFGITMESLSIIWDGLVNLKFLGFAGVNGVLTTKLEKIHFQLKTIRFVDCAVSDEMVFLFI